MQMQQFTQIPIRVFNLGATPATLKKAAVAQVLQTTKVLEKVELKYSRTPLKQLLHKMARNKTGCSFLAGVAESVVQPRKNPATTAELHRSYW